MLLWFAWKFVPLWYQQQLCYSEKLLHYVVICLKIRTFVVSATTEREIKDYPHVLWFAWKFVPLWYQQQQSLKSVWNRICCDLLENSYLCGISNNCVTNITREQTVVICLKIRTFVVSATTKRLKIPSSPLLWFAWKFVPLWYQQQRKLVRERVTVSCDLLENSYLCGISNNLLVVFPYSKQVVICLKIRTFVVSATT